LITYVHLVVGDELAVKFQNGETQEKRLGKRDF